MTYVKTWAFGYNTPPTDQTTLALQESSFVLQLADFLLANGYTCASSCDSTQYGNSNYWTGLDKVVFGTGAHSWIVLKSPEGAVAGLDGSHTGDQSRIWFEIDCAYASSAAQATFRWHTAEPTTGASTSVAPTSATQLAYAAQQFLRSTYNNLYPAYFHFQATTDGAFIAKISYSYAGYEPFILALFPLTNVPKKPSNNYDYPYAVLPYANWYDAGKGALQESPVGNTTSYGWVGSNQTGYRYPRLYAFMCWGITGAVSTARLGTVSSNSMVWTSNMGATYIQLYGSSEYFPATGDNWSGSQILFPIFVICTTAGSAALMGQIADFFSCGQASPQGSVDAVSVTMESSGSYWLPSDAGPTL
jgi:hypothetical protein